MKSKWLKSIVVIAIGSALIGGLFVAKSRHASGPGSASGSPSSASSGSSAPSTAGKNAATLPSASSASAGSAAGTPAGVNGVSAAANPSGSVGTVGGAAGAVIVGTSAPANGKLLSASGMPSVGSVGTGTAGAAAQPFATAGAQAPSAQATSEMTKTAETQKGPECFQVSFTSNDVEGRIKDNAFAFQKNLLKLPEVALNLASRCVRVDGKPVRFESAKDKPTELTIAPLTNINSVVTASYCLGEAKCHEPCALPAEAKAVAKVKDEFLEAIGGEDEAALSPDDGKWTDEKGAEGAKAQNAKLEAALDPEIKRELANLDEVESKPKKAPRKLEIFSGWTRGTEAPACETKKGSHS